MQLNLINKTIKLMKETKFIIYLQKNKKLFLYAHKKFNLIK